MSGKRVLITGSTSGIGLGIARAFAADGCSIMLNGLGTNEEIQRAQQEVRESGAAHVKFSPADMRDPDAIKAMVETAVRGFGGLDILVNNAGIQHVAPVQEFPLQKWNDILAINLSSAFHTIRSAVPGMVEQGWGRIVNIASAHALVASPFKSAYVAAKHGVAGLTKTVALEVAEKGVTVNAVCPGYVRTPLVEGQVADTARARGISEEEVVRDVMLFAQPTREFVTIEQVAGMVTYLCSDGAANVTGAILSMDGGWTAK